MADGIEEVTHRAWGVRWKGELLAVHFADRADAEVSWYLLRGEPVPLHKQQAADARRGQVRQLFMRGGL